MFIERKFSFFKNKTTLFDWLVILLVGFILMVCVFICAFYLLGVSQKTDVPEINTEEQEVISLDKKKFDKIEQKFEKRKKNLKNILGSDFDIENISENNEDVEVVENNNNNDNEEEALIVEGAEEEDPTESTTTNEEEQEGLE